MRTILLLVCLAVSSTTLYAASATYKYDNAGKLIEIEYDDGTKITYLYDKQGNMITSNSTKTATTNLAWLPAVLDLILEE